MFPVESSQLLIYFPAALALNLTPGTDMLYCAGQGLQKGPKAGIVASLGIAGGAFIHTLLAAFGVAALLATHPGAFRLLLWLGITYLIWLALKSLKHKAVTGTEPTFTSIQQTATSYREIFSTGVLINLFNPKVALFFLAFIPQFINTDLGSPLLQFLILGLIVNASGTIINAIVGTVAGTTRSMFKPTPQSQRVFRYISATIFLLLALKLIMEEFGN